VQHLCLVVSALPSLSSSVGVAHRLSILDDVLLVVVLLLLLLLHTKYMCCACSLSPPCSRCVVHSSREGVVLTKVLCSS